MRHSARSMLSLCSALCMCVLCSCVVATRQGKAPSGGAAPAKAPPAAGPGETLGYRSFRKAREILDRSLDAYGARTEAPGTAEATLTYSGTLHYRGHYNAPSATREYRVDGTCTFSRRFEAMAHTGRITGEGDGDQATTIVMRGRHFHADSDGPEKPGTTTPAAHRRRIAAFMPPQLLELANARAASLRWLGEDELDGGAHDAIAFADDDGVLVTLYISRSSHRITRMETLRGDPQEGDVVEWVHYGDHRPLPGTSIMMPRSIAWIEGHGRWTVRIADGELHLGARPEPTAFAVPEPHRAGFADWTVQERSIEPLAVTPIGRDLYMIELPDHDNKVLFAVMDEYVIAMEAPVDSETGERILATIRRHAPDRPVRYVIMSHHHEHYIGGARAFVSAGVTLVTTPGNEALLRARVASHHRVAPDRLARAPREPQLLVVKDRHVFEDPHHRIEVYDLGPGSKHTDEYLITYVPSERLLFEGDLANFSESGGPSKPSPRARGLLEGIRRLKLDVARIVQSWPLRGQRKIATYEDLVRLTTDSPPP
ncbi:hypothetical protein [Sorangium sp. So ce385]|uniref:hypothetical protein n=1 Tax=Sorangium sp. So ce385 TaxID=3133308 RepID=UPI003F5BA29A